MSKEELAATASIESSMSKISVNSADSGISEGPDPVESMDRAKRLGDEVLSFMAMKKGNSVIFSYFAVHLLSTQNKGEEL